MERHLIRRGLFHTLVGLDPNVFVVETLRASLRIGPETNFERIAVDLVNILACSDCSVVSY
jgi:hypothetical protein